MMGADRYPMNAMADLGSRQNGKLVGRLESLVERTSRFCLVLTRPSRCASEMESVFGIARIAGAIPCRTHATGSWAPAALGSPGKVPPGPVCNFAVRKRAVFSTCINS